MKTSLNPKKFGLQEADWDDLINAFKKYVDIEAVYLFGSRAMGNYKKSSDIDLVIKGRNVNHQIINLLSDQLNEETYLPYFIDIVSYDDLGKTDLKDHIDRVGVKIYSL